MNTISITTNVTWKRTISKAHRMPFIPILEPDMHRSSGGVNFKIQAIDCAECKLKVPNSVIGLLDFYVSPRRPPDGSSQQSTNSRVAPDDVFQVFDEVCPATRQIVIDVTLS